MVSWFLREPLLREFTDLWVVEEEIVAADAIVALGGGANTRTFTAADVYNRGLVGAVLIPRVLLTPIEEMGIIKSHTDICKEVVLEKGVPLAAIQLIGQNVSSFWEEAQALRQWAGAHNAKRILVPIEFIHTRRLRWVMRRVFDGAPTEIRIISIDSLDYERDSWWTDEDGLIAVQNELLKYILYRLRY